MIFETLIKVSRKLAVGPQPDEQMLERLKKKGFKTIVNLRNNKEIDQPLSVEEEQELVEGLGMTYKHFGVSLAKIKPEEVFQFCLDLEEAEEPVYVHCCRGQRSGPLSLILYGKRRGLPVEKVLNHGEKVGITWSAPFLNSLVETVFRKDFELTE